MAAVPRARRRLLQCSVTVNSHAPMAYMNSDEIARHILAWLDKILKKRIQEGENEYSLYSKTIRG